MFNDLLESAVIKAETNKNWSVVFSGFFQTVLLGVLVLVPLIYTQALPTAMLATMLIAPPPPPPSATQAARTAPKPVTPFMHNGRLEAPRSIPTGVAIVREPELPPETVGDANPFSPFVGIPGQDVIGRPAPSAPPAPKDTAPTRIRQGGTVTAASLLHQTRPVYPPLALQARIQGSVVLHAIIDRDGKVVQLEVISGHPLLVPAAIAAVQEWRYRPTLLNGEPVEVDTTITVTFSLGG